MRDVHEAGFGNLIEGHNPDMASVRGDDPIDPHLEVDERKMVDVLAEHGLDEGQPEQVAGRWVEAGIEDPAQLEEMIRRGITQPEDVAQARAEDGAGPGERHSTDTDQRDTARGSADSRSRPGDELEQEPQQPNSPP